MKLNELLNLNEKMIKDFEKKRGRLAFLERELIRRKNEVREKFFPKEVIDIIQTIIPGGNVLVLINPKTTDEGCIEYQHYIKLSVNFFEGFLISFSERKGNEFSLVARTKLNDNLKKEATSECIATEFSENRYNKIIKSIEEAEKELCIYKMVEENIEVVYDEIASEMGKHYEKEFRSLETQIECLKKIRKGSETK